MSVVDSDFEIYQAVKIFILWRHNDVRTFEELLIGKKMSSETCISYFIFQNGV